MLSTSNTGRIIGGVLMIGGLSLLVCSVWRSYIAHADDYADIQAPNGDRWHVVVADTPAARAAGLADRSHLPDDGLLMVFPSAGAHAVWMRGMRFPLDLMWIDSNGRVVAVRFKTPTCDAHPCDVFLPTSSDTARYVLELAAGVAERAHLDVGSQLIMQCSRCR